MITRNFASLRKHGFDGLRPLVGAMITAITDSGETVLLKLRPLGGAMITRQHRVHGCPSGVATPRRGDDHRPRRLPGRGDAVTLRPLVGAMITLGPPRRTPRV